MGTGSRLAMIRDAGVTSVKVIKYYVNTEQKGQMKVVWTILDSTNQVGLLLWVLCCPFLLSTCGVKESLGYNGLQKKMNIIDDCRSLILD